MLTKKSKQMLVRSIRKTRYIFKDAPKGVFAGNYGIYIHVPFCRSKCMFCPFYKELFDEDSKNKYLDALCSEITATTLESDPEWLYFGGGTPNILSLQEIENVLDTIRKKVRVSGIGVELLPELVNAIYLKGLQAMGVTKVSFGIESLHEDVLSSSNRSKQSNTPVLKHVDDALRFGLWVNVDLMLGLPNQTRGSFLDDIEKITSAGPSQVTIYPYMVIGNSSINTSMPDSEQFSLIEEAGSYLETKGYSRQGIWVFAKGTDIYDSSRDELITEYAGFGPAAFSTFGDFKVVNPELVVYLDNWKQKRNRAFIAPKTPASDAWRRFARMVYDLQLELRHSFPLSINFFTAVLILAGYGRKGFLTKKGIYFAHDITKSVVQSLPFPLQNSSFVENWGTYSSLKNSLLNPK